MKSSNAPTHDDSEGLGDLMRLPTERAGEFERWSPGHGKVRQKRPATPHNSEAGPQGSPLGPDLTDAERSYLRTVMQHPREPSGRIARLARLSPKRAQSIRHRLVQLGFLREHAVNTGGRGRSAIVLEPLEPARRILAESDTGGSNP